MFVVGGANSAGQAALHFAKYAASVTIVIRGASLDQRMSRYLVDRLEAEPSITVRVRSRITRAVGDGRLERLVIADETAGEEVELPADALFIMIGGIPVSERVEGWLRRDENGFMVTGADVLAGADQIAGGLSSAIRTRSRRASLESSSPVTPVMGRSSESHPRSAKPRSRSSSCIATLRHGPSSNSSLGIRYT